MANIKLFHTTSNYNKVLPGFTAKIDKDIGVKALWTSVASGDAIEPCCNHHQRVISLGLELFKEWSLEDQHAKWTLFYVTETSGNAHGHTFYKYLLILSEKHDELKECKGSTKYKEVFTVRTKGLFHELGKVYRQWFRTNSEKEITEHFHIGIVGGTAFDTYRDENESQWAHLRPDLPKVHQLNNDAESEAESLTFSEIFKKFAFENDEQSEGDWVTVRSTKKAKDGCLPFCFEADTNIFPDIDGVFRHYCRAAATWACKRKTCRQPSKDDETQLVRTTWRSFNSWYHEHLKDHEGQGLRKGFERQYCKQCWKKSKDWVEGQICSFQKPMDTNDKDKKRPPHDETMCEMCMRLKAKGFDKTCSVFKDYVARGVVKVTEGSKGWDYVGDGGSRPDRKTK